MKKLTEMQNSIYRFIGEFIGSRGYPPSVREIGAAVGLKSPSTVHFHLKTLEKMGLITRDLLKKRAISITGGLGTFQRKVPILGTVTAGAPILAVEQIEGYLPYDTGGSGEYFALRVRGDSMKGAGIFEGDFVIVRKQNSAENGEIVVALLEDEATVKRLRRQAGEVLLMPENPAYSPLDGSDAAILGKVTALIRNY